VNAFRSVLHACAALAMAALACAAWAQTYPAKPIRLIFPLVAGSSSNDILGRALAQHLSEALGKPIVADYRPGTAGNTGSIIAARAVPDGYTLVIGYTSAIMISPILNPSPDYHPVRDLAPIAHFASVPYVIVVHPSVPATNIKELIALAQARPGQLNFASAGTGGLPHLAGEYFKMMTGVDIVHVPYKGGAPAHTDLLGGHVQLSFSGITGVASAIKAGKLRAIAAMSMKRSALLPELVTAHETGLTGMDVVSGLGLLAPARTPPAIIERLYGEIVRIVNGAEMRDFILKQGAEPVLMDPAQFSAHIKAELAKWGKVVKAANLKAE
jgi:tripartite-type tricarboxylate transporter receptor subunit TctC